jgi:hypothetical protein
MSLPYRVEIKTIGMIKGNPKTAVSPKPAPALEAITLRTLSKDAKAIAVISRPRKKANPWVTLRWSEPRKMISDRKTKRARIPIITE